MYKKSVVTFGADAHAQPGKGLLIIFIIGLYELVGAMTSPVLGSTRHLDLIGAR